MEPLKNLNLKIRPIKSEDRQFSHQVRSSGVGGIVGKELRNLDLLNIIDWLITL